ncbi:sensor histidine kinase [Melittangium boletus]|uniref:sensor histidine kinase n=1 Tax=Melittangium boletus TaxID=83453 RepID=UPI003DA5346F
MATVSLMLSQFLTTHREQIIALTQKKIAERMSPRAVEEEFMNEIPLLLEQLIQSLQAQAPRAAAVQREMEQRAVLHGQDMLRKGFTVSQLVHDYGAVCQAITEFALEQGTLIATEDYHFLNRFLDDAIAEAVTGYGSQHEQALSHQETGRMGFLAHELRNLISAASLAYQALSSGRVGITGNTGKALGRSLAGLRDLVDRSLSEVRLASGIGNRERVRVARLIENVEATAMMDAEERGLHFLVLPPDYELEVDVDRQLIESAMANLLQNAFKFTQAGGHVSLRAHRSEGQVLLEVEDECGGLPPGKAEELFRPFEQRSRDRSGLGLGLAISLRSVQTNEGTLSVRDLPGKGCIFTIALPLAPASPVET